MRRSVLQDWVSGVGMKTQSILLSGLRAPDVRTVHVKRCVRWLRARCQVDADPAKQSYMQQVDMTRDLVEAAVDELEYLTCHYAHHLADAFAVVAYHHPDAEVRRVCEAFYCHVAEELFHFVPESREQFLARHADKFDALPEAEGNQEKGERRR